MIAFEKTLFPCSVCGKEGGSGPASGSPDIDLRPSMTERCAVSPDAGQCPGCWDAGPAKEEKLPGEAVGTLPRSGRYADCGGIRFRSEAAAGFYRRYLTLKAADRGKEAREAVTSAAWMCDDAGDWENAAVCRRIAAELIREQFVMEPSLALTVLWAEHMRRAGEFDRVLDETAGIEKKDENGMLGSLLAFERIHAGMRDPGCYTIASALEEMRKREGTDPEDRSAAGGF